MNVHELLGRLADQRQRRVAGPLTGRNPGESVLDAAWRLHEARAAAYAEEMRRLHEADRALGGREEFIKLMRRAGRV